MDQPLTPKAGKEGHISLVPEQVEHNAEIQPLGKSIDLVYQPLKLVKVMENRYVDSKQFRGLKVTQGLTWIPPEAGFRQGIFKDLLYDYSKKGQTKVEFLIVVTMYNEDVKNFRDTMIGITENLEDFKRAGVPESAICCIIIVDGLKPFLQTFNKQKQFFSQFFDEQKIKDFFHVEDTMQCKIPNETDEDEFAHCFMQNAKFDESNTLQFIFCVKQKNRKKLNTHLWFFGGFCEMFNPNYVMLLDVGTRPLPNSLFLLYECMKTDVRVAGCCGEIRPMEPSFWNLVVGAQMVEYKFAHIFDKALESVIGYITVLPGAFSAYRWEALQGAPLWEHYFKSICHPEYMDAFQSNIYLAEDRVLCLALVSKKNRDYILRYVKDSVAETDVPDKLSVLMAQRRRWINGSWFALIDSIKRMSSVFESGHSTTRKCCFTIQMIYYVVNVVFSWFMVGSFFLAFAIAVRKQFGEDSDSSTIISFSGWIIISYTTLLIIVFIMALGVKPKRVEDAYKVIACIFGVYMLLTMGLMFKYIITNLSSNSWIIPLMVATIFCFAMNTLCHSATLTVLKGVLHFVFLSPSYVNLFLVYAICNIHDCTWGNRPDQQSDEERAHLEEFEEFRTRWAIVWALCNSAFAYYLNLVDKSGSDATRWYIYSIAFVGVGLLIIRFCGGIMYLCQENWCQKKLRVKAQVVPSPMPVLKQLYCDTNQELLDESRNPIIVVAEASRKNTEEDKDESSNEPIEEEKLEIEDDDFDIDSEENMGIEENVNAKGYPKINVTVVKPAYSERKVFAGKSKKYKHIKNAIRQPIKNSKFLNELMKAGSHKAQKSALMIQSWFRSWKCRETYQNQRRFFDYLAYGKTILQHSFYFVSIYKTIKEAHFKNRLMRKKVEVNIVVDAYPLEKGLSKPIEFKDNLASVCSKLEIEPDEAELRRQHEELIKKVRIKNDLVDISKNENKEEKIIARKIYTGKTELADGVEYDLDIIYIFGTEKKVEISAVKGKFSYFYTMYLDLLQDLETVQKKIPFILSRLIIDEGMLQFKS